MKRMRRLMCCREYTLFLPHHSSNNSTIKIIIIFSSSNNNSRNSRDQRLLLHDHRRPRRRFRPRPPRPLRVPFTCSLHRKSRAPRIAWILEDCQVPVDLPVSTQAKQFFLSLEQQLRSADAFTGKLMDQGKFSPDVSTRSLTESQPISYNRGDQTIQTPPRLVSDQLINIYFQEWAPLYPVVHRPTVLKAYEQYLADSLQGSPHDLAQLNLIFGIAALASTVSFIFPSFTFPGTELTPLQSRTNQDPTFFEKNWTSILESLSTDISVPTLQCFVLAQIYCMTKADYSSLLRYRGLAVGVCHQLRLHQSQKHIANPLVSETRKKVFWCQYVLDRYVLKAP